MFFNVGTFLRKKIDKSCAIKQKEISTTANLDEINAVISEANAKNTFAIFTDLRISEDFSERTLSRVKFKNCDLSNSIFKRVYFHTCIFDDCDFTHSDFTGANFSQCEGSRIRNAHKAKGLENIYIGSHIGNFETAIRPLLNVWLDWERLGIIGRIPLFAGSTSTIVFIPTYIYFIEIYNKHINAFHEVLQKNASNGIYYIILSNFSTKIGPLKISPLTLYSLIAAILLLSASLAYGIFCPIRIKEFSRERWCYTLDNRSIITYWPVAWKYPVARIFAGTAFLTGGCAAMYVILNKLYEIITYIALNS